MGKWTPWGIGVTIAVLLLKSSDGSYDWNDVPEQHQFAHGPIGRCIKCTETIAKIGTSWVHHELTRQTFVGKMVSGPCNQSWILYLMRRHKK